MFNAFLAIGIVVSKGRLQKSKHGVNFINILLQTEKESGSAGIPVTFFRSVAEEIDKTVNEGTIIMISAKVNADIRTAPATGRSWTDISIVGKSFLIMNEKSDDVSDQITEIVDKSIDGSEEMNKTKNKTIHDSDKNSVSVSKEPSESKEKDGSGLWDLNFKI